MSDRTNIEDVIVNLMPRDSRTEIRVSNPKVFSLLQKLAAIPELGLESRRYVGAHETLESVKARLDRYQSALQEYCDVAREILRDSRGD